MADYNHDQQEGVPATGDRRHTHGHGLDGVELRDADLEPQRGIRYVAWLFKGIAALMLLVMMAELSFALSVPAGGGVSTLLGESVRLLAFAGLLWGAADLALMLIKSHYDLRATRILLARQNTLLARLARPAPGAEAERDRQREEQQMVQLHREAQ